MNDFSEIKKHVYSDIFSIVLNSYSNLIDICKNSSDFNDEYIQKLKIHQKELVDMVNEVYNLILFVLQKYPKTIKRDLVKSIQSADKLVDYVMTPIINETAKPIIKNLALEFDYIVYNEKSDDAVIDNLAQLIRNILNYEDTTLFNGIMLWLSTVFTGDWSDVFGPIQEYIQHYHSVIQSDLDKIRKFFNIKFDKLMSNDEEPEITLTQDMVFYKGVKYNKRDRLNQSEKHYFLSPNLVLAFSYAQMRENDENTIDKMDLREHCQKLGYIGVFNARKPLKLLNIGNFTMMKELYSLAADNETVEEALENSYFLSKKKKTIDRDSDYSNDIIVSKFICSLGYDGYYGPLLDNGFPPEIMVCSSDDMVLNDIISSKQLIKYCNSDENPVIINNNVGHIRPQIDLTFEDLKNIHNPRSWDVSTLAMESYGLADFGDRDRNIIEIFKRTSLLENCTLNDLREVYKNLSGKNMIPLHIKNNKTILRSKIKQFVDKKFFWKH